MTFFSLNHSRTFFVGFLIAGVCFFLRCAPQLSGGTSTTDNPKVIGTIIGNDKQPASKTLVVLLPENADPLRDSAPMVADTTDDLGRFVLPVSHQGVFNIQAVHLVNMTRLLIRGISVAAGDDSIEVSADTLKASGFVRVELPDSIDRANGYLYIPGTTVFTLLAGAGAHAILDSVPAATLPAVCYTTKNAAVPTVLRYDVRVLPGAATVVAMPNWKYSARLSLNTTASGANVTGSVTDFPAFIRLTGDNFDFAQTVNNGADLRFTKSDNTLLSYEIERWDANARRAEIRVKIDTIYGNDSTQSIMMYWGNPTVAGNSSGPAVFDSASGFEGVWHLNETSGTTAVDASYHGFSGSYKGKLPYAVSGPVGYCQTLSRQDSDFVDIGNVLNPDLKNISLGAWIKRSAFGAPQALIAKTNGGAPSASYGYLFSFDAANFVHFYLASGGTKWGDDGVFDMSSNAAITDSVNWHYVFVVIDRTGNGNCKIYIDGMDRTGNAYGNITTVNTIANTLRLRIGTENDGTGGNKGSIGEATIAFTARSADWVKVSYMNQKAPDALIKW